MTAPPPGIEVRALRPQEALERLPAIEAVLGAAYGRGGFGPALARRVTVQPDGFVVALAGGSAGGAAVGAGGAAVGAGGEVVGAGAMIAYPDAGYGWLGLIGTRPDSGRRGIGAAVTARLLELLAGYRCAAVLDATAAGAPLYRRLGFVDAGVTTVLVATTRHPLEAGAAGAAAGSGDLAAPLLPADLAGVADLDRACTGADRTRVLGALFAEHPHRGLVVRRSGALVGAAFATERAIAPLLAVDEPALRALLAAALRLGYAEAPTVAVPPGSAHRATLAACGFVEQRTLTRMRRGLDELPGARHRIAGQASLGEG